MEETSLEEKFEGLKLIKQTHPQIRSIDAFRYLQYDRIYRELTEDVCTLLQKADIRYRPTVRDVTNSCELLKDATEFLMRESFLLDARKKGCATYTYFMFSRPGEKGFSLGPCEIAYSRSLAAQYGTAEIMGNSSAGSEDNSARRIFRLTLRPIALREQLKRFLEGDSSHLKDKEGKSVTPFEDYRVSDSFLKNYKSLTDNVGYTEDDQWTELSLRDILEKTLQRYSPQDFLMLPDRLTLGELTHLYHAVNKEMSNEYPYHLIPADLYTRAKREGTLRRLEIERTLALNEILTRVGYTNLLSSERKIDKTLDVLDKIKRNFREALTCPEEDTEEEGKIGLERDLEEKADEDTDLNTDLEENTYLSVTIKKNRSWLEKVLGS